MDEENGLIDYDVYDSDGNKIGSVENYWVDEQSRQPEFVGVKTGWIFGKTHVIPLGAAQVDAAEGKITLPYDEGTVKDAPSFDADRNLEERDEARVREHYGATGAMARERPAGATGTMDRERPAGLEREAGMEHGAGEVEMPLAEEDIHVGKRETGGEAVRLRKVVRTEHKEVPVDLGHEEVHVERVPANEVADLEHGELHDDEAIIETKHEEPVIEKERRTTGGVRAYKTKETEHRTVEGEVRREDAEVDREPGAGEGRAGFRGRHD